MKKRIFKLDNDTIEVAFRYNKELDMYFGCYPDFSETPRFTPNGKPWVNVTKTDCPYSQKPYNDCGSCKYLIREKSNDLIGVCLHKQMQLKVAPKSKT